MASVEAEFENGLLRPIEPLKLREGERVELTIKRRPDPSRWDLGRLAQTAKGEDLELASRGLDGWQRSLEDADRR